MRIVNLRVCAAAALLAGAAACSSEPALESGALLLSLSTAAGASAPDELRISVYDDTGVLWKDARVPAAGALLPESASRLGTVLVQPGATSGNLRLHVRGLVAGAHALDGVLVVSPRSERAEGSICRSIPRCPPTTMATAFRTASTTALPRRTPISGDVAVTMLARTAMATVRYPTRAWTCAPTAGESSRGHRVQRRGRVHIRLLRRRRLLRERMHRTVPLLQPAEHGRHVPRLPAGDGSQ